MGSNCPYCKKFLDGATDIDGDALPKEGDFTICAYCSGLAVFGTRLILREPTTDERMIAMRDPQIIYALELVKEFGLNKERK